jgi:hypothetical protein
MIASCFIEEQPDGTCGQYHEKHREGIKQTMTDQTLVIGTFEQREAAYNALQALHQAGFLDDQLGFITRQEHHPAGHHEEQQRGANSVVRGIVGGIMGAADILLAPITGPSDANLILESTLPVVEEAIDRLPYPHSQPDTKAVPADTAHTTESNDTDTAAHAQQAQETATEQEHIDQHERTSIVTGSIVGGTAGAIGALGALLIPGVGPVVAGGILALVLGGAGMGGVAGGFLGAFIDIGVPEHQAHIYERAVKSGKTVVTIKAGTRAQDAAQILRDHGAHDVQTHTS